MTAIYGKKGVKAGFTRGPARETVLEVARELVRRGAEAVLAGCTEIPLVLRARRPPRSPGRSHDRRGPGGGPAGRAPEARRGR
ncbi:MAG: hypothetical protein M0C28_14350 [Candidatus Moduliflexus flocculans]|nr:hypothetical protein [Candidatus Moduliflexus flocculans]